MLNREQIDEFFQQVYKLAEKGRGKVAPNPMVGAILVKNGKVIAEGYHSKYGAEHAERVAIEKAGKEAKGATLFVNLEPCSHLGNQPPCVNLIVEAGISAVYFAVRDPNPLVKKNDTVSFLREKDIKVHYGFFDEYEYRFNEVFYKNIREKMPFVTIKGASSIDGKIATAKGESKWITGDSSRDIVHELRNVNHAILIGVGTVIKDDPKLTTRIKNKKRTVNPYRIILDSAGRTPVDSGIIKNNDDGKTIIVLSESVPKSVGKKYLNLGAQVLLIKETEDGRPDIKTLLKLLYKIGICSLLVEGGSEVNAAFLRHADKFMLFISPRIIGGKGAFPVFGGRDIGTLSRAVNLVDVQCEKLAEDFLFTAYPKR